MCPSYSWAIANIQTVMNLVYRETGSLAAISNQCQLSISTGKCLYRNERGMNSARNLHSLTVSRPWEFGLFALTAQQRGFISRDRVTVR